jgi:hypothetical protein
LSCCGAPNDTERSELLVPAGVSAAAAGTVWSTPLSAAASATSAVTTHSASFSAGINAALSSISARTGVIPVVPMISAEVIVAPSQCDMSMIFWPQAPGKKYLLRRCCDGKQQADSSLWRRCLDGKSEFDEARLEPAAGLGIEAEFVVSTAQVLDERMPATDNLGGADAFEAAHRSRSGLQPA